MQEIVIQGILYDKKSSYQQGPSLLDKSLI